MINKKHFKITVLLLLSIFSESMLQGQTPVYDEHITITAPYRPSVSDANKIDNEPRSISLELSKDKLDYDYSVFFTKTENTPFSSINLPDYKFEKEKLKQHIFYAKLGIGSNLEPLAHISVNSSKTKTVAGGFNIMHNSAWRNISPVFNNKFSDNHFDIYGKIKFGNQQLLLMPYLNQHRRHYALCNYQDTATVTIAKDDMLTAKYTNYGAMLELSNVKTLNTDYSLAAKLYTTKLTKQYSETQFTLPYSFSYYSKVFRKSSYENLHLDAIVQYDYSNLEMFPKQITSSGNYLVNISPNYSAIIGRLKFCLGIDLDIYSEDGKDNKKNYLNFALHPLAEIKTYIIPDAFSFTIGVSGQSYRNNLTHLLEENKYIAPIYRWKLLTKNLITTDISDIPLKLTNEAFNAYTEFNVRFGNHLNLSASANLLNIKDKAVFYSSLVSIGNNEFNKTNQFNFLYEDVKQVIINTRLSFSSDNINADLGLKYISSEIANKSNSHFNALNIIPKVYNTPKFIIDGSAKVLFLNNKLELGLLSYIIGGVEDVNFIVSKDIGSYTPEVIALDLMYDLFLTLKYRFTDNISLWLNANSLLHYRGNRLMLYNYYPEYPMNVMGGITLSF